MDFSPEIITIFMLGGVLVGVLTGFPLAYVIGFLGLVVGLYIWEGGIAQVFYLRMYRLMINYVLLAVPLFVFMGSMLERSGIIERLYEALYVWMGGFRGGLAVVTVVVGTVMAATVGIITASVTLLTLVALPSMIKRGYSKSFAAGACTAGGILGILIPPSIMIVIYGPMAEVSVGKMFFGAFIPGFILSACYVGYIVIRSFIQKDIAPPVPPEQRNVPFVKKTSMLFWSLVPPGILIFSVLGVIFFGIAPPTEAAGCGAFMATLLTLAYRRLTWEVLRDVMTTTMKLSGFIFLVGTMSFAFVGVFLGAGCGEVVTEFILSMPGGKWGAFGIIMIIVFVLGFFIDWIGILFIMVPIITPIFEVLGFHPVWAAIMVCVNLQTSFMTPPFAMGIYICRGAADPSLKVTIADIIRGVIPYVLIVLVVIVLLALFPQLILWLPTMMID
ncbi:MAG: C4-dicarboxylate ABC transporter [Dehalococcoidales bacterium]|jgi:tripartite ATP-independent transporter DctM subunit|nr:C4-dicarboxylate ABC transporter [Dehalococcoidales bacterium]MDP6448550.1 TRAP transporter large permease subunit [Dehalococcoidales bacterium]MDP6577078.1 TRAP transporter large permease subunit [Dehalococcoidales bacterium]